MTKQVEEKQRVVIRFAGDSGDGMQLTGDRFTNATAVLGNDLATMPDFPAEIRAPAGTVHGVSAFQIQFASTDILTPGDHPDVLVAMNPAALKAELGSVEKGGTIIVNEDAFTERNLQKAGYASDPLSDGTLDGYQIYRVPMTSITVRAVEELGLTRKEAERSKNMFALGLVSWMYGRPTDVTLNWLHKKFGDKAQLYDANVAAFKAGYNFGETTELFATSYEVKPAPAEPGIYRNVSGAQALAWGLVAAAERSGLQLFYASYPITPASELLHELSRLKNFNVMTLQAEDEIAAANVALGAAFAGDLGVTGTSGPGMDLKAETLGLAVMLELPMVIVDVQRAGPSTGMPTKTEQADLLLALFGRHGESPMPIVAARSSAHCFDAAIEAARIAITYRTPVILLSDTFLANSSEPWKLPGRRQPPDDRPGVRDRPQRRTGVPAVPARREARAAVGDPGDAGPAAPDRRAREGGRDRGHQLRPREPRAHDRSSVRPRSRRSSTTSRRSRSMTRTGTRSSWCSAGGRPTGRSSRPPGASAKRGRKVATAHLVHLNPMPANTGEVVKRYAKVLIPEINTGQLSMLIRSEHLVDAKSFSKVQGQPIFAEELEVEILKVMDGE